MSDVVLSDAQMGMFTVLKPFAGFEGVYHGQPGTTPIAFPGTLDPDAGKTGFEANLLRGLPVPLGGRLQIWIPMAVHALGDPTPDYAYQFVWRVRNQRDVVRAINEGRQPTAYHLPSQELGRREDEVPPTGEPLYFIPGASDVQVFEQAEPADGPSFLNVMQQRYVPKVTDPWEQPLTPSGDPGVWQQGTYQASSANIPSGPTWVPLWVDACGDELMILAYKTGDDPGNWDFNAEGADAAFGDTFGTGAGTMPNNPNIGILVSSGTMGGG